MVEGKKELSVIEGSFSMTPRNLTEAMEFSKLIAQSEICPTQFKGKAGDVLVAVQMGMEVGLKPLQAIQNIAVINGRPTMWGDAVKGLVEASGLLEYCVETWDPKTKTATCRVKRKNRPESVRTFSMEDATRAGLAQKDTYVKYGPRMCQMRARSYGLRDDFADVLKGLAIREEVEDFQPTAETPDGTQVGKAPPRRKSEVAAEAAAPAHEPLVVPDTGIPTPPAEQKASEAAPPANDGKSGTWTGQIERIETKRGESNGKAWTLYAIHGKDGWKCATFSDTHLDVASGCQRTGEVCVIRWTQGKHGPKAESVDPAGMEAPE